MDEGVVRTLLDQAEIQETVLRYGRSADQRDWEALISCLNEEVDIDYNSLSGGEPERIAARDLVLGRWAPIFESLDATQHFTGPCTVSVDGDEATAVAYFQAQHVLNGTAGGEKWTLGGNHDGHVGRRQPGPSGPGCSKRISLAVDPGPDTLVELWRTGTGWCIPNCAGV
ncbi:MAG: nuclear transport factor 2 family protein [Actinobacteria bacterium]|nr:nuclear transport factor 2 family protein [Actinomycetota bacterium]